MTRRRASGNRSTERRYRRTAALLVAALTWHDAALAQDEPANGACLGFNAAIDRALAFDPRIEGAAAQADAARADVMAAQSLSRPSLSVFGQTGFNDVQPIDRTRDDQIGVQATLELFSFGQRRAAQEAARARLEAARHGVEAARVEIAESVALAYLDYLRALAVAEIATDQVESYAREAESAEIRLERAVITVTDASQIRSRFAVAKSDAVNATVAAEAARIRLSILADAPVPCADEDSAIAVLDDGAEGVLAMTETAAAERAKSRSFELRQARAGHRAAEARLTEAKRANLPVLSANAFALYNYGEAFVFENGQPVPVDPAAPGGPFRTDNVFSGDQRVGLSLRQDLYAGGRNRALRADARAGLRQARSDVVAQTRELEQRVRLALVQARAARDADRDLAEASQAGKVRLDAALREYELGSKTVTDLVLATDEYYGATRQKIEARFSFYAALVELYGALGTLGDGGR